MKKISTFVLGVLLVMTILLMTSCSKEKNSLDSKIENNYIYEESFAEKYDYYNISEEDGHILLEAIENVEAYQIDNAAFGDEEDVSIAYSLNYDIDAEVITVVATMSDANGILNVDMITAYPFSYADGTIDAYMYLDDGTTIYLSEVYDGEIENCFSLTLGFSLAGLIAGLITAAKVTAVITAVIVVGGITIQAVQMTKAKLEEKTRAAEAEKTKKNPCYYYPATRKSGKLLISNAPQGLILASKNIVVGQDYWSPYDYTAKNLVVYASGGYVGPEIDSKSSGKYWHYHLSRRVGGHSFYGTPVGGAY